MFWKKKKTLVGSELAILIKKRGCGNDLIDVLKAVRKHRHYVSLYRNAVAENIFSKVADLSKSDNDIVEDELFVLSAPPSVYEKNTDEKMIWSSISSLIFELDPLLTPKFCQRLIEQCLNEPVHLNFALVHSEGIAYLASHHLDLLDIPLVNKAIKETEDSRAIYALKTARCAPDWSGIRDAVLYALTSKYGPKRVEAMWLTISRSKLDELFSFVQKMELKLKCDFKDITNVRDLAALICASVA
jgi:hypothetical protein